MKKRIFILFISILTLVPAMAQTQEDIVSWFNKAVEFYNQGNYVEAVKWFRKAAEQGHAIAQYNLGNCYDNGWGVTQNYAEAVKWYRKAAEQGLAQAQYNLGICYENGWGVPQNKEVAIKWYRKAAQQGLEEAKKSLKDMGLSW
jgi:TPR repeat protein